MSAGIRIGIVGAGSIVRSKHLPNFRRIAGVEIVAVCNRSRESGEKVAAEFGIAKVLTDWRALVALEEINAVLIGTWPYMHHPVTLAALEAGKHVLCESRMCMNAREAREMLAKARASDRVTMLCPPPIGLKGDYVMKRLIAEGYIGELRHLTVVSLTDQWADPSRPLHWRQTPEYSGVNTLQLGMYAEAVERWVGRATSVSAHSRVFYSPRYWPETGEPREVTIPDAITITAQMANGALSSWVFNGVIAGPGVALIELAGSEGRLLYWVNRDEILGARAGERELKPIAIPESEARRWTVEEDFVRAIREGTPVSPNFEDGVKYMEFTEAAIRAAETGQRISLPLQI